MASEASDVIAKFSSKSMNTYVKALSENYTNWVFDRVLPNITYQAKQLRRASENGGKAKIDESLKKLKSINSALHEINNQFSIFIHRFQDMVKFARENTQFNVPEDSAKLDKLDEEFMYIRGVIHDSRNFIGYASGVAELYDMNMDLADISSIFDSIDELDLSKLNNNIVTAASMHNSAAIEKNIKVVVSNAIPPIQNIPKNMLRMIFRTTSELVLNAIKYSDPAKNTHWITVDAIQDGRLIDIVVEDNGVGIENIESVLAHGNRERPDLAKGTGTGLAALSDLANKKGLTLSIESTLGKGSIISLRGINHSKWTKPTSSSDNDRDDGMGEPPTSSGGTRTGRQTNVATSSHSFGGFIPNVNTNNQKMALLDDDAPSQINLSTSVFNCGTHLFIPITPKWVTTSAATTSAIGR